MAASFAHAAVCGVRANLFGVDLLGVDGLKDQRDEAGAEPLFIGFDEVSAYVPEAVWLAQQFPRARWVFRTSNQVAQATAARSGVGLALLPHYIARTEPALRVCRFEPVPTMRDVWLLTRRQDRKDVPIRTVADHLVRLFADERALFET